MRRCRIILPDWMLQVWLVLLAAGWIIKLTGNPAYWYDLGF